MRYVREYMGPAPRAADSARYARARKNTTNCEGGQKEDPWFDATSDLIVPSARRFAAELS